MRRSVRRSVCACVPRRGLERRRQRGVHAPARGGTSAAGSTPAPRAGPPAWRRTWRTRACTCTRTRAQTQRRHDGGRACVSAWSPPGRLAAGARPLPRSSTQAPRDAPEVVEELAQHRVLRWLGRRHLFDDRDSANNLHCFHDGRAQHRRRRRRVDGLRHGAALRRGQLAAQQPRQRGCGHARRAVRVTLAERFRAVCSVHGKGAADAARVRSSAVAQALQRGREGAHRAAGARRRRSAAASLLPPARRRAPSAPSRRRRRRRAAAPARARVRTARHAAPCAVRQQRREEDGGKVVAANLNTTKNVQRHNRRARKKVQHRLARDAAARARAVAHAFHIAASCTLLHPPLTTSSSLRIRGRGPPRRVVRLTKRPSALLALVAPRGLAPPPPRPPPPP